MEESDFLDIIQSPSPSSTSPNNSLNSTSVHSTNSVSTFNTNNASNIYTFSNQTPSNSVHHVTTTPPPKRLKYTHSIQPVDRLSQLPDALIHQILSLLPIKNAVASSILSKRWLYKWTYMPDLIFKHSCDKSFSEYVSFINNTVRLYSKSSDLKCFSLQLDNSNCYASNITSWIRFAVSRNVEDIDLNLFTAYYDLPQFLFVYKLVKSLHLRFCKIAPLGQVSWTMLRKLTISSVELSNELVENILLGSPVLEYLELHRCEGITRLDVKSTSVRKLVVKDDWFLPHDGMHEDLEISGDNLRSLSLVGRFYQRKLKVSNVGSLVDIRLDFELSCLNKDDSEYEKVRSIMREIFNSIQHVKEVAVGKWCIQALSLCELKGEPSPLSKHKLLKVDTYLNYKDLPGIARLLQSSPDLETLVLNMACDSDAGVNADERLFGENNWASQETRFCCLLLNLSTVKFVGCIPDTSSSDLIVPLMKFLLEKARVLKKLIIYPQHYNHYRWWLRGKTKDLLIVGQTLLSFPRSSPEAEIILHPLNESSY